jgi:flagellar biosynthesis regulator FlaF
LKANRRILTSSIDEEKEEENLKQKESRAALFLSIAVPIHVSSEQTRTTMILLVGSNLQLLAFL